MPPVSVDEVNVENLVEVSSTTADVDIGARVDEVVEVESKSET